MARPLRNLYGEGSDFASILCKVIIPEAWQAAAEAEAVMLEEESVASY